ncbi:MAG: hypothetical protein AAGD06_17275 [Acidobacteriota bacterium]
MPRTPRRIPEWPQGHITSAVATWIVAPWIVAALLLIAAGPAFAQIGIPPACLFVEDPTPDETLFGRPVANFPGPDHLYLHSSTHLQGQPAYQKWTGGLVYRPPISTGFGGFTSAVIVNNPDPDDATCVEIEYFSEVGATLTTNNVIVPPEGFHVEAATPLAAANGVGTANVRVVPCFTGGPLGPPIVGASLLHSRYLFDIVDRDRPLSFFLQLPPGMSSMQQMQEVQETSELWWGPLPVTGSSATDFMNGATPFPTVVNPSDADIAVVTELWLHDQTTGVVSGPLPWRTAVVPGRGSITEFTGPHLANLGTTAPGLWNYINSFYGGGGPAFDVDVLIRIYTPGGEPILGDIPVTDTWGNGIASTNSDPDAEPPPDVEPVSNLVLGKRFRMLSTMLYNGPTWRMVAPDNSTQTGPTALVRFIGGVANVSPRTVTARFEYFSRDGTPISTGSATLTPGQTVRIEPGAPGYPGYREFGWLRVTGCAGGELIGWTGHEIQEVQPEPHYHKVFGQTFAGINRAEPGDGIPHVDPAGFGDLVRKVSPLVRVEPTWYWPGYTTFVNDTVPNLGPYRYQFYDPTGLNCTQGGRTPFFAGLPWSWTSTSYEDPEVSLSCAGNLMGTVDHTLGVIEGIDVLGDPFDEYGIPDFAGEWFPGEPLPPFPNGTTGGGDP